MLQKLLPFILFVMFCSNSCKEEETPVLDQLPAATTEGLGTFGCLVNGQPFVETGTYFNTYYQYVEDGYYFSVHAEKDSFQGTTFPCDLYLRTNMKELEEGNTYDLLSNEEGGVFGEALFYTGNQYAFMETGGEYTGELTITKFIKGVGNPIVSGTFWFDVENPFTGETVHITNGRFDTMYID